MNAVSVPSLDAASLYVDYVFLDTEERRRFAQLSHEYLSSFVTTKEQHKTIRVEKHPKCAKMEIRAFTNKLVASISRPQMLVAACAA